MKKNLLKIAEIKIGKSDKLYDYFCNDLKVQEGDFVYVENINFPVFVYDIKSVTKEETLANKSILKIVDINKNVKVLTKYEDVTKIECDCVVNSLGTTLNVFGSICKAIVTNAHSKEIDDLIKNHPTANIFDIFVTDAGDLNCKKVIHIVMPFKENDRYNNDLKEAFCKVIDKAIELGLKSIAIPKIGTGANGYSINDIYDALRDVTLKYQYTKDIELEIINLLFDTSVSNVAKERKAATRQKVIHRIDSDKYFDKFDEVEEKTVICNTSIAPSIEDLEEVDDYKFKEDITYINELINHKYGNNRPFFYVPDADYHAFRFAWDYGKYNKVLHLLEPYYTKDMCKKMKSKQSQELKKMDCFRLALLEKMDFTVTIQFMQHSGFSFSPLTKNDLDLEVFKYIYTYNGFVEGKEHFVETIGATSQNANYIIDVLLNNYKI